MNHPDVEILDKETLHKGFLQIDRYRLRHRKFDGNWSEPVVREVCERGHAVGVLLYDPDGDRLVLIEQFRIGPAAAGRNPWIVEIVAGVIDDGETPEEVARREAMEEAGCTVREIETVCDYFPSPGGLSENITLFCGRVDASGLGGIHGVEDEHEDIRVRVVTTDEAIRMLDANELNNSVTIIAIQWLARHRDALRRRWCGA